MSWVYNETKKHLKKSLIMIVTHNQSDQNFYFYVKKLI